jgi:ubiquinone biosynthesis protein COQ4
MRRALARCIVTQKEVKARMADIHSNFTHRLPYFERVQTGLVEATKSFIFPSEAEHAHLAGETSCYYACQRMKARMLETESGRRVLAERPRMRSPFIDKDVIAAYPPNTLGGAYHKFLSTYGYEYDQRPRVRHTQDEEIAYIFQRYKEIHDFYHVCLQLGVTLYDELNVKFFESVQTSLPGAAGSIVFGHLAVGLIFEWKLARKLALQDGPRVIRIAQKSKDFMSIMFEDHFNEDFHQFRKWIFNAEDSDDEALENTL